MPHALADFFFIAGLEGHEPAILNAGGHYTSSNVREDTGKDASLVQGTIREESSSRFNVENINIHRRTTIGNDELPASSSSAAYNSRQRLSSPVSETPSERETSFDVFQDVMARFTSERDEFLSRLAPHAPLTRPTPPTWQSSPHVVNEDRGSELNHVEDGAPSSVRRRSTLRTKLADLSRRTSRAGNIRRANTIGYQTVYLPNSSVTELKPLFGNIQRCYPDS